MSCDSITFVGKLFAFVGDVGSTTGTGYGMVWGTGMGSGWELLLAMFERHIDNVNAITSYDAILLNIRETCERASITRYKWDRFRIRFLFRISTFGKLSIKF